MLVIVLSDIITGLHGASVEQSCQSSEFMLLLISPFLQRYLISIICILCSWLDTMNGLRDSLYFC